jgi:hypothetical protein
MFNIRFEFCFFSGFETACSLALHGCILRSQQNLAAIGKIKKQRPNTTCEVIELHLARLHSITKFAADFKHRYK